ncbi:MAG TPA: hypothetical protein VNR20_03325 [Terriglobales bacterium]|nr:hypothetical protein [Terriglobales bacterium]
MLNKLELLDLALGKDEARKVDLAIPQDVFNQMTPTAREDVAGWYYAPEAKIFGRLLTLTECWKNVMADLENGKIVVASVMGVDDELGGFTYRVRQWPCLKEHVLRGEITLARKQ